MDNEKFRVPREAPPLQRPYIYMYTYQRTYTQKHTPVCLEFASLTPLLLTYKETETISLSLNVVGGGKRRKGLWSINATTSHAAYRPRPRAWPLKVVGYRPKILHVHRYNSCAFKIHVIYTKHFKVIHCHNLYHSISSLIIN